MDGGVQVGADLAEIGGDLVELGGDFLGALHRRGRVARAGGQAGKGIEQIGEFGGQSVGAGGGRVGGVGDLFAQIGLGVLQVVLQVVYKLQRNYKGLYKEVLCLQTTRMLVYRAYG